MSANFLTLKRRKHSLSNAKANFVELKKLDELGKDLIGWVGLGAFQPSIDGRGSVWW
jgi:hypothetical protein